MQLIMTNIRLRKYRKLKISAKVSCSARFELKVEIWGNITSSRDTKSKSFTRFGGDLLSHALRRSTIGATVLNGRVRDGTGCFTCAMTTKPRKTLGSSKSVSFMLVCMTLVRRILLLLDQIKPIEQLVPVN